MIYVVLGLALIAPLLLAAVYVDDWSRDLTTNTANTSPEHPDQALRPLGTTADADRVAAALAELAAQLPRWSFSEEKPLPSDSPLPAMLAREPVATHHLVHSSGLLGFRDDVWLVVEAVPAGADGGGGLRLHAESRSRVGKGDLGQNPRNLRELNKRLRAAL